MRQGNELVKRERSDDPADGFGPGGIELHGGRRVHDGLHGKKPIFSVPLCLCGKMRVAPRTGRAGGTAAEAVSLDNTGRGP